MSLGDSLQPASSPLAAAVLTISDTRTIDNDVSGRTAIELLLNAGHQVVDHRIVPDLAEPIRETVLGWAHQQTANLIVATGGTGLSPRDVTCDAVVPVFEKPIPGFGELFRALSFRAIGPAAMLSRAAAGTIGCAMVFLLPGSPAAVRLALTELILPQAGHIRRELTRSR